VFTRTGFSNLLKAGSLFPAGTHAQQKDLKALAKGKSKQAGRDANDLQRLSILATYLVLSRFQSHIVEPWTIIFSNDLEALRRNFMPDWSIKIVPQLWRWAAFQPSLEGL